MGLSKRSWRWKSGVGMPTCRRLRLDSFHSVQKLNGPKMSMSHCKILKKLEQNIRDIDMGTNVLKSNSSRNKSKK